MKEKSHQKLGIQNTKFAKGTTKVTKETDAAVSVVDGVLQKQHLKAFYSRDLSLVSRWSR
jgi:hypothetical protein